MQDIDPWQSFKAEREEPEEESALSKILMTIFFIIIGAAIGAFLGFLSFMRAELRYHNHGDDFLFYVFVIGGALIGSVTMGIFVIRIFKHN